MVKTNLKSYTPPPTRKSSRIAASISPECNKSQEKSISIHSSAILGENDQEDEQQEQGEEVMSKKLVEKMVSSKKAKQVAVESELVHVDNDALVSADEEEVEIVERNKKR
ncbi:hypothetical protein Tco_1444757 [Tanacetum coccineum]